MKKHPYQTCLRMPLTLKEEMTTICDEYHINESDLMRRAIVQFVENIKQNPQQNSLYMFLWGYSRTSLGYDTLHILITEFLFWVLREVRKGIKKGNVVVL